MKRFLICLLLTACGDAPPQAGPTFTGLPLSDADKAEVIRQILETNTYINNPKPPGYYIVEVRPTNAVCDDPHAMAEYVNDLFYDQTHSDKDREVGKVLLCYSGRFYPPNKIIITREALVDRIARFESEHLALYHSDRQRYEDTKYHTAENRHPILK